MGPSGNRTLIVRVGGILIIPFVLLLGLVSSSAHEDDYYTSRGAYGDWNYTSSGCSNCGSHHYRNNCGGCNSCGYGSQGRRDWDDDRDMDKDHDMDKDAMPGKMQDQGGKKYGQFPGVGKAYALDLGTGAQPAHIIFESADTVAYIPPGADDSERMETSYVAAPIGKNIYLIGWQDSDDGRAMSAALDFSSGAVTTISGDEDGSWQTYAGTLTPASLNGNFLASARTFDVYGNDGFNGYDSNSMKGSSSAQYNANAASPSGWTAGNGQEEDYGAPMGITDAPGQLEGDYVPGPEASSDPAKCSTLFSKQLTLRNNMRALWDDHVTWTRNYILSTLGNLGDQQEVTSRLLQNQNDIGTAFGSYFGAAAGAKLTALLKEHISDAGEVVAAAQAKDNARLSAASKKWSDNANAIAAYLNSVNPDYWPLAETSQMLQQHLKLTTEEVQARLKGDWQADIEAYDQVHQQSLQMADTLSNGIIMQFPNNFN